ncbi:MAG TPA: HAD-IA family hydrolase [Burkholderiales bacterium]|nr:HAD-IA family hydrolase [Burkholderiales bacterium]
MIRAVLFDLDGTLADTAPDLGYALNLQLQLHGREPLQFEQMRPHTSSGTIGLLRLGFGVTPGSENFDALRLEFMNLYEQNLCRETTLFPGVPELLADLESRGLPWGIVTNKPKRFTPALVKLLGVFDRAACVISGDSTARPKPHPDSLFKAAEEISVAPEEALYVGDDQRDVQAARAARMLCLIAGYGYLGADANPSEWGGHAIINHPSELLDFL